MIVCFGNRIRLGRKRNYQETSAEGNKKPAESCRAK